MERDKSVFKQKIAALKFKPTIFTAVFMIVSSVAVNYIFTPQAVAVLPFMPWEFFRRITHRNLPGENYTECSVFFFYIITRMAVRPILAKFFKNGLFYKAFHVNA